jgi:hypothetical protein
VYATLQVFRLERLNSKERKKFHVEQIGCRERKKKS